MKPFGFLVGRTVFRAVIPADNRVDKASVRSESADGIPKFWKNEKICGRLPASPPTESEASLDVPPVRSTFARENGPDQEEQNEQSTIEKDFSVRNGTDVFRLDYKEKQ